MRTPSANVPAHPLQATFKATLNPTTPSAVYVYANSGNGAQTNLVTTSTYAYYVDYNTCKSNTNGYKLAIRNGAASSAYCLKNLDGIKVGWAPCTTINAASCWAVVTPGDSGCDPAQYVWLKSGRDGRLLRHKVLSGTTRSLYSDLFESSNGSDFCWQISVVQ